MKRLFLAVLILVITQGVSWRNDEQPSGQRTVAGVLSHTRLDRRPSLGSNDSPRGALAQVAVGTASLGGYATFYDVASGNAAAGPDLRAALGGDPAFRGETVRVCSGSRCLRTTLTDWCACRDRNGRPTLIDLARSDFARLGSTSRGVLLVTIELDAKPVGTLPPTDMEGP